MYIKCNTLVVERTRSYSVNNMFKLLLSVLFPPSAHEKCIENVLALVPQPHTISLPSGTRITSCAKYTTPEIQASILLLKKHRHAQATSLLSRFLADVLTEELADTVLWNSADIYIVPIPLSPKRERVRGFNQVTQVCKALPPALESLVRTNILIRTKDTPMQKSLERNERLKNVRGVFALTPEARLTDSVVFLIDDVTTTGATLDEATKVLKEGGANVVAIALARA